MVFRGGLFSEYFLTEGIIATDGWRDLSEKEVTATAAELAGAFREFRKIKSPNESQTERDLIDPVIRALGWEHFTTQLKTSRKGRSDVPDYLLFADGAAKERGLGQGVDADAYGHGATILEAKAWGVPLDRASGAGALGEGIPSNQILRYLNLVEVQSEGRIRWGILTNGRYWRLYYQGARSRAEDFLELDVAAILGVESDLFGPRDEAERIRWMRVFILLFARPAFISGSDGKTFHQIALEENRLWEERVTSDLSSVVFNDVFPRLAAGLAATDRDAPKPLHDAYLKDLREATLTYLYRLLFVLYAEDRDLLPTRHKDYDDYGLHPVRDNVAARIDKADKFSEKRTAYDHHLRGLWRAIDEGDSSIGLPPYNGGLFQRDRSPLLDRTELPDAVFAPILDLLSRRDNASGQRQRINYRDLNVQHLGSIYERLLEFDLVASGDGVAIRPQIFARKGTGSYYTPEELVALVIHRTVGPLLEERREKFKTKARALTEDKRPKSERLEELAAIDPASAFLELKICDPAMGSGHFLVSLVDFLGDEVLRAMADAPTEVDWLGKDAPYVSPLVDRLAAIRDRIKSQAAEHDWQVTDEQLEDKQLVRRMILKRVIYGVDKNPMAVELAKLSLWLHTFTVGAPLSFLDHHLRVGDSLFGEWVRPVMDFLAKRGGLFINSYIQSAKQAAAGMAAVEAITDADIAEVHQSAVKFQEVETATQPLHDFMALFHAWRWLDDGDKELRAAFDEYLDGTYGDPVKIAGGKAAIVEQGAAEQGALFAPPEPAQGELPVAKKRLGRNASRTAALLDKARVLAKNEGFFAWQAAFPGVWSNWESAAPTGGFDAVIGNPPWDRIKLQEVEWFAARNPEIAHAQRASDRKNMIAALKKAGDPLWAAYDEAAKRAEAAARVARICGHYPLLSGGDINLYALFVEQAHRLIKRDGLAGLIVPSGIAADKSASDFFKSVTTAGRLACLLDFENRGIFFPDVHRSFKFCAFVAGGLSRTFAVAECAFFLRDTSDSAIAEAAFPMTAGDFAAVNPNTGTAPIFRSRRDADITTAIYRRTPVLVDRRRDPPAQTWPVRYMTMFHMTNDSHLFKTREELEADGYYPTAGNRMKKGDDEFVPLYEGKMVQAFDHRAASIVVNPENLHRPAQPEVATLDQHRDPEWLPNPQFYVSHNKVSELGLTTWSIGFKDVTAPTNIRTMIASALPLAGMGNTIPIILTDDALAKILLLGQLNSIAYDFTARQKVQGQHLNWFIVEQLPVLPASAYDKKFGAMTAAKIVKRDVLHLTYTAHDMEPFARDMGYDGPPFIWDEDDRRHRRARLDALYFHLYGIGREDADYILSTFPIVEREDRAAHGRYLTRDLILAYMNALAAGDADTVVKLR